MTGSTAKRGTRAFAQALCVFGLLFNPWLIGWALARIGRSPGLFAAEGVMVLFVDVLLLAAGTALLHRSERVRLFLGRALLAAFGSSLALVALEVFLQLRTSREIRIVSSEAFHHDYAPNTSGLSQNATGEARPVVRVDINSLGMRGPLPPPLTVDAETPRVLLLGDSFVQADELAYPQLMGVKLAGLLGDSVTVLQHGMASWSPILELNWLARRWDALQPARVVLFLCVNDFFDADTRYGDPYYRSRADLDAQGLPQRFDLGFSSQTLPPFIRRLVFPELRAVVRNLGAALRAAVRPVPLLGQETIDSLLVLPPAEFEAMAAQRMPAGPGQAVAIERLRVSRADTLWSQQTEENVAATLESVEALASFLEQRGRELSLTVVPYGWEVSAGETVPGKARWGLSASALLPSIGINQRVRRFAEERSLPYLDLHQPMSAAARPDSNLYFPRDGHWTARGHEVVSRALREHLGAIGS